jgi:hypothetical protein
MVGWVRGSECSRTCEVRLLLSFILPSSVARTLRLIVLIVVPCRLVLIVITRRDEGKGGKGRMSIIIFRVYLSSTSVSISLPLPPLACMQLLCLSTCSDIIQRYADIILAEKSEVDLPLDCHLVLFPPVSLTQIA